MKNYKIYGTYINYEKMGKTSGVESIFWTSLILILTSTCCLSYPASFS